jgi:hypothetical protein
VILKKRDMNSEETGNFKFGCLKKERQGKEMSRNSKIVAPESSSGGSSSKLRTIKIYC